MDVGDRVIRTFDCQTGVILGVSSAPGFVWMRFDSGPDKGLCHAVYTEHLRVVPDQMSVSEIDLTLEVTN
jgi:hypothetical protein